MITVTASGGGLAHTDTLGFNRLTDETIDIGSITDEALSASVTFSLAVDADGGLGFDFAFSADPVPEPASWVLFLSAIGLAVPGLHRRGSARAA
jgi:hypothetical protein